MLKKNVAVVGFPFTLVDKANGSAITSGTVTGYVTLDGGTQTAIDGTPVHKGNGQWTVNLTAAEMNGDLIGLLFVHDDAVNAHFTIPTYTFATGTAITFTYTVTLADGVTPISGVKVQVSTDASGANVIQEDNTDTSGIATFYLDPGSYYFWRYKDGYQFTNPDTETVS